MNYTRHRLRCALLILLIFTAKCSGQFVANNETVIEATPTTNQTFPVPLTNAPSINVAQPYNPDWWKTTVIYQIYPRSFADSDGNGIGDLPGITSRLGYVQSLGVRAVWISPFYESPQDDMGYDVSNFTRVDPLFGTNADFGLLLNEAHRRGIRVILDLVPGHTSYKCEWFEKSRNKVGNYTDYYVWHAGDPARPVKVANETRNGVPNNWVSVMGNSMWAWDEVRGEYYLHQFLKEQPDLNYRNPLVRNEMQDIILFWLDKGVDGFRIDAFAFLVEEEPYLNNDEAWHIGGPHDPTLWESHVHTKTKNQPETFRVLQDWREMVQDYEKKNHRDHIFMVTEVYGETIDESMLYDTYNGRKGADFTYNFNLINISTATTGHDIDRAVNVWLEHLPKVNGWPNFVTGNHDVRRVASRVGENNPNLVDGFNMLLLLLPGTPTTYYGEEIGMTNNYNITLDQVRDKYALTPAHISMWRNRTRDYQRTPMQWNGQLPSAGFSAAGSSLPWLPVHENAASAISVKAQQAADYNTSNSDQFPTTHLGVYKKLIQLRNEKPFILSETLTASLVTPTLYSFIRQETPSENSSTTAVAAYLIAFDLRHNGTNVVRYNFTKALENAGLPLNGRIIVRSTRPPTVNANSSLWSSLHITNDTSIKLALLIQNWSDILLGPGESFVAEF